MKSIRDFGQIRYNSNLVEICLIRSGGVVGEQRTEVVGTTSSSLETHLITNL